MTPAEKIAKLKSEYQSLPKEDRPPRPKLRCLVGERRAALGLTLSDVGNAVGLSKQAVMFIERGDSVGVRSMIAIAKFFGVAVVDLWPDLGKK